MADAARQRLCEIAQRRAHLLIELAELKAEETTLRRFFRVMRTKEVQEALTMAVLGDGTAESCDAVPPLTPRT